MYGDRNRNECRTGSFRITSADLCISAAISAGLRYGQPATTPDYPSGCYRELPGTLVSFNRHATGAANPNAQLLCSFADTPTIAPTNLLTDAPIAGEARAPHGPLCWILHARG
jgi:hypothetical protein